MRRKSVDLIKLKKVIQVLKLLIPDLMVILPLTLRVVNDLESTAQAELGLERRRQAQHWM